VTIHLSIVVFMPLAAGVAGLFLPRLARWLVVAATVGVLAYWLVMLIDFERGAGLQYVTDTEWISELGVHYALAVDGLNLFLVGLTAALWVPAAVLCFKRTWDRPHLLMFHLGFAETAVLGAFLAQDLALFVVFFDLMLVPFYFLVGTWGERDRVRATTKLVIYTLVGSLLMLAAAIALGVLATPEGGQISFLLSDLEQRPVETGTQDWIFLLFALAFLVKAPAFPVHGWMPDAYRATPIPILMVFSAVVSKVGVYGFLRIVLPVMPDAAQHFQELLIVVAVVSILYGSVLAFSQVDARLVVGYSSIAQLGFITLGIFSLDPKGAQGAVMQMVNHGLVAAALFMIIAVLSQRTRGGSESLDAMGGVALRAPVLAAMFLIVTFATLAMPGSPNFVGEILILFGTFEDKLAYGIVASAGVVLAGVYMIRIFQRSMHYRTAEGVESKDICRLDVGTIVPVTAIVVALGIYPHFVLDRTEEATTGRIAAVRAIAHPRPQPAQTPVPQGRPFQVEPGQEGAPPGAGEAPPGAQPEVEVVP
jgi:NADH-quinone oxidoreductase subunit M